MSFLSCLLTEGHQGAGRSGGHPWILRETWEMDGGWTNLTFILETKNKRDSPPCTFSPLCLQSTSGAGSSTVGAEVPAVFVEMLALPGGYLLPNMKGTEERRPGTQHQALRPTPRSCTALPLSLVPPAVFCSHDSARSLPL